MKVLAVSLLSSIVIIGVIGFAFEKIIIVGNEQMSAGKVNRLIYSDSPEEIPIFGSSRAEGSYIPEDICPDCFNYGLSGSGNYVLLTFLELELKKTRNTPIIVNLDPWNFSRSLGSVSNYLYNSDVPEIKKMLGTDYKWYFGLPIVKYYGRFEEYITMYLNGRMGLTKYINQGAAVETNSNGLDRDSFRKLVQNAAPLSPLNLNCPEFNRLKNLCAGTSRRIVFVLAPIYGNDIYLQEEWRKSWDKMEKELKQYKNVTVLDCSGLLDDEKDFFNVTHVSLDGAHKFSTFLSTKLNDL